jgi:hypothetical protein
VNMHFSPLSHPSHQPPGNSLQTKYSFQAPFRFRHRRFLHQSHRATFKTAHHFPRRSYHGTYTSRPGCHRYDQPLKNAPSLSDQRIGPGHQVSSISTHCNNSARQPMRAGGKKRPPKAGQVRLVTTRNGRQKNAKPAEKKQSAMTDMTIWRMQHIIHPPNGMATTREQSTMPK